MNSRKSSCLVAILKRKQLRFTIYYLAIGLMAVLALVVTACSSKVVSSTSTTTTTSIAPSPVLTFILVTPTSPADLAVGSTQQFVATGSYADGSNADISSQVTWASSDSTIATISSTGLAVGVAGGSTDITASIPIKQIKSRAVTLNVVQP